ncbi:hypothetical protein ACFY97_18760 [Streptomyces klenkii]|uniref:hypothetical protein n=1 Tax=Streptomyces klenkii TaxID=1420899 RepID=UPI0036E0ED36
MTTYVGAESGVDDAESRAQVVLAEAQAAAIRARAQGEADAARIKAEAEAERTRKEATAQAERDRIANERAAMRLEKEKSDHGAYLAERAARTAKAKAAEEKERATSAEEAQREADREAEQKRSEAWWKWGARGIYAVCLVIAAPVQFLDFWDEKRPFLVAAPGMLEGIALVLACGAAWAVAHRRDVMPYRIGIMLGAAIAATINLRGGLTNPAIGFNAGMVGAIASLVGPIVLMAYEHGIAQKADGIPSWRERRAAERGKAAEDAARKKAKDEKKAADDKAAEEKKAAQKRADEEQARRDEDRRNNHSDVWAVADDMRSARGSAVVTEQIWADAWYRVTGSKTVGITPEIEAKSRAAQARMHTVSKMPVFGEFSLVKSQRPPRTAKAPEAPDGRRHNGGTPPVRRPGDSRPNSALARSQARHERTPDKKA